MEIRDRTVYNVILMIAFNFAPGQREPFARGQTVHIQSVLSNGTGHKANEAKALWPVSRAFRGQTKLG